MREYTRREFIGASVIGVATLAATTRQALAADRKKLPIGVQLYSVRGVFQRDIPGTLAGIKKIGFDAVEFAGYFSYENDAKGLRKLLDDNGLKCCGTHLQGGLQPITGDNLNKTIEFNEILGNSLLVVPSFPNTRTLEAWAKNAETLSEVSEKLKPRKMRIGYHNHWTEFQPIEGERPEDYFFGKASPEVFMQLDIGHCLHGGGDPVAYLKKFAGRVLSVHAKDYGETPSADVVGQGKVKWPEVLEACETIGGTQWYIIEEESGQFQGLDGIDKSFQGLKKFLA